MILTIIKNTPNGLMEESYKGLQFEPLAPVLNHIREEIDGGGLVDVATEIKERKIAVAFLCQADNYPDSLAAKRQLAKHLFGTDALYLISSQDPKKRWPAKLDEYSFQRASRRTLTVTASFTSTSGLAESLYKTLEVPPRETYQLVNGLWDGFEPDIKYEFTDNDFMVWNDSDVLMDPRRKYVEMSIKFEGPSNKLRIENKTSGDVFEYKGSTAAGSSIELIGIRHLKNGQSIFKDTNHKLITLEPGWNNFKVTGTTGDFRIKFDCRFYYV